MQQRPRLPQPRRLRLPRPRRLRMPLPCPRELHALRSPQLPQPPQPPRDLPLQLLPTVPPQSPSTRLARLGQRRLQRQRQPVRSATPALPRASTLGDPQQPVPPPLVPRPSVPSPVWCAIHVTRQPRIRNWDSSRARLGRSVTAAADAVNLASAAASRCWTASSRSAASSSSEGGDPARSKRSRLRK